MFDWIFEPWPWYISGPLIGLMVPLLLLTSNKKFGISSSLRHMCSAIIPTKAEYFNYNLRDGLWQIIMTAGIIAGGAIGAFFLSNSGNINLSQETISDLTKLGITDFSGMMPAEIFSLDGLLSIPGILLMAVGGFLVGFGARYANGCTSGHAIMGLSLLSPGSLIAVIGFFIGGLIITHFIFPFILNL